MPNRNDRCEYCGVRLRPNQASIWVVAAAVVCGNLLLGVLMLAGYDTYQWMERQDHKFLDYPVWHEPLDDWNL